MNTDYLINQHIIISKYLNQEIIEADPNLYGLYTVVSANLSNYLPEISIISHLDIFIRLLIHKKLSTLEQANTEVLQYLKVEGLVEDVTKALKKGAIISTFHTGSYRLINLFLVKNNIPFTLVISKAIIEQEGNKYISDFGRLRPNASGEQFKIMEADSSSSGLQMLRELKRGRSLLLYLDGNSGAGADTINNHNHCVVDFLEQQLYARKGIGHLAYTANVPIIPVISYRTSWDDIRLKFHDPIFPDKGITRDIFSLAVTQRLYDQASPIIREYPEQWEAWLYLHRVCKITQPSEPVIAVTSGNIVTFNLKHFGIFQIGTKSFLFQKNLYQAYAIKKSLYRLLRQSIREPINVNEWEPEVLNELVANGVLLYLE